MDPKLKADLEQLTDTQLDTALWQYRKWLREAANLAISDKRIDELAMTVCGLMIEQQIRAQLTLDV